MSDIVGDSLQMAQMAQIAAQNKEAKYIVVCGVHFMAETTDMLTEKYQEVFYQP
ncbi:quinolinate synthase NadA [endosymbiont 'TC1' of Trimyema compressum]|uniref:quinolinate synthase NadA n=1 Tax=endosymbiont 'TC1' of Trimyema compressum TaxID=243899 RepID=UPI00316AEC2D